MRQTLTHRGPDEAGTLYDGAAGIAMRRLRIIDLAGGRQPIANEDESVWVVCNGEIYNYVELRAGLESRGHRFRTKSDTEVLVHLYEEKGEDFLAETNGMFALAIWDRPRRRMLLARDRMGEKPLYYRHEADGRLLFGSEVKAIRAAIPSDPGVDEEALHHYLTLQYAPGDLTLTKGVRKVLPGEILAWEEGGIRRRRYWDLEMKASFQGTRREAEEEFRRLLKDACRIRLRSDVPLGLFLSGGVDSSGIVAAVRSIHEGPIQTFSVSFTESSFSEAKWAAAVARQYGTEHHEIPVTPEVLADLPRMVASLDDPLADVSTVPTWYLSRETRRHVTVALSGDGGDELFAGYHTYVADRIARALSNPLGRALRGAASLFIRSLPVSDKKIAFEFKARRFLKGAGLPRLLRHAYWMGAFDEEEKRALYGGAARPYDTAAFLESLAPAGRAEGFLSRTMLLDHKGYLPDDILAKVDRMSMSHALEVRIPYLDPRIVKFASSLPPRWKLRGFEKKSFMKSAFKDWLPSSIRHRKKQGFSIPIGPWFKGPLKGLLEDALSEKSIRDAGLLDPAPIRRLVAEHLASRANHGYLLWNLLTLHLWRAAAKPWPGRAS